MGLNYITSNGITPGGHEVGLEPPTTFTHMVGDGNCLFRALAHIITGSEEQHMDVRRGIVSHMRTIGNLLVGGHVREGDIDTYIDSSRIEHDREWGTDVEILTLAHMLKTPVYTYHEDTKSCNRYSPNAVEWSLDKSNISERGRGVARILLKGVLNLVSPTKPFLQLVGCIVLTSLANLSAFSLET